MDTQSVVLQIRQSIERQVALGGDDEAVANAAEMLLESLDPVLKQAVLTLAEQASAEIGAQLPSKTVEVVLSDGEPTLRVRSEDDAVAVSVEDLDARMTVRLPEELKDDLEDAASELGDSVNTFVVRALTGSASARKRSSRATFKGTIDT